MIEDGNIEVYGAREHNLKNIDVVIPRNKLVVVTGLSGSGKSSLAFDTIYAEGQRRYIESFAAYARQFLGGMERPDVDKVTGLSPVISIEQKTTSRNPRSTVGTITEIYDFLRLLFARTADAYSYNTGELMVKYSDEQIVNLIIEHYEGKRVAILAPVVKGRKGHYRELFEQVRKSGFTKVRIDGEIKDIVVNMKVDRYKIHDIEIVVDRLEVADKDRNRLNEALKTAMRYGKGTMMVHDYDTNAVRFFSRKLMCPTTGISYDDPAPNLFSFNSPYGACHKCNGLGQITEIDIQKIVPNPKLSIKKGAILPIGEYKATWIFAQLEALGDAYGFKLDTPFADISQDALDVIFYGTEEVVKVKGNYAGGLSYSTSFEGIVNFITNQYESDSSGEGTRRWAESFMNKVTCPECHGTRLKKEALYFKLADYNIAQLADLDINQFFDTMQAVETQLTKRQLQIGAEVLKEINTRTGFLLDIGLDYLKLNMSAKTLSGGEAQRIRLATQIGSALVGVLYILDEPSIGLHQRDNTKLIKALQNLRDAGNSVMVVEHDKEMMEHADHILDIGPGAGIHGGKVVAQGNYNDILNSGSLTAQYLNNQLSIEVPKKRRPGSGEHIVLKGAKGNNLQNVTLKLPLGKFVCVTGVSGSGKSSLINETLYPILSQYFYKSVKKPLPYTKLDGIDLIDKVIDIDQTAIGRTPRSNPATYTGVFTDIRNLFSSLPEAKIRGYGPGRFSFNVKGGRCETCRGGGLKVIEMNFLPDVQVLCETCNGKRYNRETLEIRYKGKTVSDVLNMTIQQAVEFFENIPSIIQKIRTLNDVGLGYITLGQASTTLSGGEAQRVKLATELSKRDTGKTLYLLDEPSTGLHFEDIRILLDVLQKLTNRGNSVLVIEHNMDIIKVADWIIDVGPDGGKKGGLIIAEGTPEQVAKTSKGFTAHYLKKELGIK